jgi:hypothetical protein
MTHRNLYRLAVIGVLTLVPFYGPSGAAQTRAPAELRAVFEGTWQLDEWHINGQILRPPQVDGRWSNHDGVVMVAFFRADTGEFTANYGVYEITADTWSYRYTQRTTPQRDGPPRVAIQEPPAEMRPFKITRAPGKVILEGAGEDRREYEGPYFTFMQGGRIVRKWKRVVG